MGRLSGASDESKDQTGTPGTSATGLTDGKDESELDEDKRKKVAGVFGAGEWSAGVHTGLCRDGVWYNESRRSLNFRA